MTSDDSAPRKLTPRGIRVSIPIWNAFGRVAKRDLKTDRNSALVDYMVSQIREHGDAEDLADLEQGLKESAERRSRMHPGRPRKQAQ